jgi:hypothetical protein
MIRTRNPMGNRPAIRTRVDTIFSYRTEIRIAIRFAANRTAICVGNCIRVDGPLVCLFAELQNIRPLGH